MNNSYQAEVVISKLKTSIENREDCMADIFQYVKEKLEKSKNIEKYGIMRNRALLHHSATGSSKRQQ